MEFISAIPPLGARTSQTRRDREGYSASQIQGPLLKRQLTDLIKAARPEPLDRHLARGVLGN
jgi:hypothetical protein